MIVLYRKIVHKIKIYAYWLRSNLSENSTEADNSNPSEVQGQWNTVFGDKNPDEKTIKMRMEILKELEED